jgi:hypothetical protein
MPPVGMIGKWGMGAFTAFKYDNPEFSAGKSTLL